MTPDERKRLAHLIREGSKIRPQNSNGDFFHQPLPGMKLCSCAIGAAWEAAGHKATSKAEEGCGNPKLDPVVWLESEFPGLDYEQYQSIVVDNDSTCGMTREKIADRVEEGVYG